VPLFDIKEITGHKDIKTLERYLRITQQESAKRVKDMFDSKASLKVV